MKGSQKRALTRKASVKGKGLINTLINKLPLELHLPGYQFCGPGTNLKKRLNRGDSGINSLDKACKEHDIAYSQKQSVEDRREADQRLINKAWTSFKSKDANFGERANALLITNIMKAKNKLGMGIGDATKKNTTSFKAIAKNKWGMGIGDVVDKNKTTSFRAAVRKVKDELKEKKPQSSTKSIQIALEAARGLVKKNNKKIKTPRIIKVPKTGGILPLIPIFAGLSAVGALAGGAAGVAKAVNAANDAKKQLVEANRHNKAMEAIVMGRGLHLKPYKKGLGLYLHPNQKN